MILQLDPSKNVINKERKYAIDYIQDLNVLKVFITNNFKEDPIKTEVYPLIPNAIFKLLISVDASLFSNENIDIDMGQIYPFDFLSIKEKIGTILNTYDILLKKQNIKCTFLKDSCIYSLLHIVYDFIILHTKKKDREKDITEKQKLLINAVKFLYPDLGVDE